jgi:hypothetical protein
MGLITKPPSWGHCSTNLTGTPGTTPGTAVTAGANDAEGTAQALLTALTHDVEYLVIGCYAFNIGGENGSTLLDILVDPAGGSTWAATPLISDLLVGQSGGFAATSAGVHWYHFPVWIKSGHSIGAQAATARASVLAGRVMVYAYGGNANPASWWCGQHVTAIGVDTATSQGTNHTPGNSGAYSTWTNFGSATPANCGAVQWGVQGTNTDTTQASASYFFEFGVGSTRIGPNIYRGTGTAESGLILPTGPIFCALPTSTQMMVRATCSGTAESLDVAAYVVH